MLNMNKKVKVVVLDPMASLPSYRRSKTTSAARKDMISQLPYDVKEKILECLPTPDAARTALLSTDWKDVWLRHGRLVLDTHFFKCLRKCESDKRVAFVSIINDILLHRAGPVKKFTLHISCPEDPKPEQSDLDRWCRYLSRNGVEELNIRISGKKYRLPSCMVSCRTITQLKLGGFDFDCPINAGCIFPGVTSLVFHDVDFKSMINGGVVSNLGKLTFRCCVGINNFKIIAPKLKSLDLTLTFCALERSWLSPHLKAIKTLFLNGYLLGAVATETFPTARNLQVIRIYDLNFGRGKQITSVLELLETSPNLCELDIIAKNTQSSWWEDTALRQEDCFINRYLKMLKTIKIESFSGSILEMHFVKALLSKSSALEKIIIQESADIDVTMAFKIPRELLSFPRISSKAQLVFMECKSSYSLVPYPWTPEI